jgi:hypothetical protein
MRATELRAETAYQMSIIRGMNTLRPRVGSAVYMSLSNAEGQGGERAVYLTSGYLVHFLVYAAKRPNPREESIALGFSNNIESDETPIEDTAQYPVSYTNCFSLEGSEQECMPRNTTGSSRKLDASYRIAAILCQAPQKVSPASVMQTPSGSGMACDPWVRPACRSECWTLRDAMRTT